ncbi:MAG: WG repeat-containing protein, partial [Clostridiales bacterium]|nr:WG repeat-containing protein [Clostridiales bacterium]
VVTKRGALFGVYDLNGNEILPMAYDRVEVIGQTVLAVRGNTVSVLSESGTAHRQFDRTVYLADENHVYCDERFYDLQFAEKQARGCAYLDIPFENRVSVSDLHTGFVGYADEEGNIVIEPQFYGAGRFSEGTAVVVETDRTASVIDMQGNRLYHTQEDKLGMQYDGVRCFMRYNTYGVLDANFREILPPFLLFVKNERAYGDYLIVKHETKETFFSLQTKNYVSLAFDEIEPLGDLFLCKSDESYSLLNRNLQTVAGGCDSVSYDGTVLTVRQNGKVAYYKKQ